MQLKEVYKKFICLILSISLLITSLPLHAYNKHYLAPPGSREIGHVIGLSGNGQPAQADTSSPTRARSVREADVRIKQIYDEWKATGDVAKASQRIMYEALPLVAYSDRKVENLETAIEILKEGLKIISSQSTVHSPQLSDEQLIEFVFMKEAIGILDGHINDKKQTKLCKKLERLVCEMFATMVFFANYILYIKIKDLTTKADGETLQSLSRYAKFDRKIKEIQQWETVVAKFGVLINLEDKYKIKFSDVVHMIRHIHLITIKMYVVEDIRSLAANIKQVLKVKEAMDALKPHFTHFEEYMATFGYMILKNLVDRRDNYSHLDDIYENMAAQGLTLEQLAEQLKARLEAKSVGVPPTGPSTLPRARSVGEVEGKGHSAQVIVDFYIKGKNHQTFSGKDAQNFKKIGQLMKEVQREGDLHFLMKQVAKNHFILSIGSPYLSHKDLIPEGEKRDIYELRHNGWQQGMIRMSGKLILTTFAEHGEDIDVVRQHVAQLIYETAKMFVLILPKGTKVILDTELLKFSCLSSLRRENSGSGMSSLHLQELADFNFSKLEAAGDSATAPRASLAREAELISDINTPGLLVHGVIQHNPSKEENHRRIISIFKEGLKPRNKVPKDLLSDYALQGRNPDWVALSMIGKGTGYGESGVFPFYGPMAGKEWQKDNQYYITLIIDPGYLKEKSSIFIAVGEWFKRSAGSLFDYYSDNGKDIIGGIKYSNLGEKKLDLNKPFGDEVWTKYIPPTAIAAIIAYDEYAPEVRDIIIQNFPEKSIRIFNPNGKLLFDIKGENKGDVDDSNDSSKIRIIRQTDAHSRSL